MSDIYTSKEQLKALLSDYKEQRGFTMFIDLSAVDYLKPTVHTEVFYWLRNPITLERVRILVSIARDEPLPTVIDLWRGADWYERELFDLFGIQFIGHPDLKRILLPDGWKGHPLRRDYALMEEPVQFVNGIHPKVPSEMIPYVPSR